MTSANPGITEYPAGPHRAPVFLVLPGGGYHHLAAHEGEPIAHWLNEQGLHAAVVHYKVGPGCWPRALHDARDALAAMRDGETSMPVDRTRVGVIGFSAGGHLAAMLATDSPTIPGTDRWRFAGRPDAAILAYPVVELRESFSGRIANPDAFRAEELLGEDADAALISELSTATRITAVEEEPMPPMFIWTTSDDEGVHPLHSVAMMMSLAVAGVPFEGHVFQSGQHGLGLAESDPAVRQWTSLAEVWLEGLDWLE